MKKQIMFIIGPSNYGVVSNRLKMVGNRIKKDNPDIKVSFLYLTDGRLKEKIKDHLENGGYIVSDNGCGIGIQDAYNEFIFKKYGSQIIVHIDKNPWGFSDAIKNIGWVDNFLVSDKIYSDYIEKLTGKKCNFMSIPAYDEGIKYEVKNRKNAVFFPATYLNPEDAYAKLKEYVPEILCNFIDKWIKNCEHAEGINLLEECKKTLQVMNYPYNEELADALVREYGFLITEYLNRKNRFRVLKKLLDNEIQVVVCGQNWDDFIEKLEGQEKEYITYPGKTSMLKQLIKEGSKCKVYLDSTIGYGVDVHERAITGLYVGCNVFALKNEKAESMEAIYDNFHTYKMSNLSGLVKGIKKAFLEKESKKPDEMPAGYSTECYADYLIEKLSE